MVQLLFSFVLPILFLALVFLAFCYYVVRTHYKHEAEKLRTQREQQARADQKGEPKA